MKSVVTYNPESVLSVFDGWDRLLGDFFNKEGYSGSMSTAGYPPVDIREEKERYVLEAELPGMAEKDVAIKVNVRVLSISSEKEDKMQEDKNGVWLIRERGVRAFRRSFTLPRNVDSDQIKANFKDGLLTIVMQKRPEAQEKTISINRN